MGCTPFVLNELVSLPEIATIDRTGIGKEVVRMLYFFVPPGSQHIICTLITSGSETVSHIPDD